MSEFGEGSTASRYLHQDRLPQIRGADITLSPVYTVAKGQIAFDRGLSLRFPRFIKRRDPSDKSPEEATTPEQVAEMYRQQNHTDAPFASLDDEDVSLGDADELLQN